MLRHWRQLRRLSQLHLAGDAGVSTRHLSFLETGRAQPSRDMIQQLCVALDLPLGERNALHRAAGFMPPYSDTDLADDSLHHVRQALDFILRQQEPYPALVIDGHWDIVLGNDAMQRLLGPFRGDYRMPAHLAGNAMHVVFHPGGLRPHITNWAEFAGRIIAILHREVAQAYAPASKLLGEILQYPDLPAAWSRPGSAKATSPVMTMHLRRGDYQLAFFSTFTTFAMPADAALQMLKIECFYPADDATAVVARAVSQSEGEANGT